MTQGDSPVLYFQLVDMSRDCNSQVYQPPGRRYVPAIGATLQVTLVNLDDAKQVTRAATQPFPGTDPSIWMVALASTDQVRGTVALQLQLTEGSVKTYGRVDKFLYAYNQGML